MVNLNAIEGGIVIKPTAPQIALLERLGVEPLPTKSHCSRLIAYLLNGNGADKAGSLEARRALYQSYQKWWIGEEVIYDIGNVKGRVRFIHPKSAHDCKIQRMAHEGTDLEDQNVNPFKACVDLDTKRAVVVSLGMLKRLNEA